jgi:hypothetical protein
MADGSKRELILENIATVLSAVSGMGKVERRHPEFRELQQFANTQLPYCGILGSLPDPKDEIYRGGQAKIIQFDSVLYADILFFAMEPENPDKKISYWADEIWAALYADITRGGNATYTKIKPQIETGYQHPYIVFWMTAECRYLHDSTGI